MENKIIASVNVLADLKYSGAVRAFASSFLLSEDVPEKWSKRLILVLDELFMNAIRYGSSEGSRVLVKCIADTEKVGFIIEDDGTGKGQIKAGELQKIVEKKAEEMNHQKTSGRGLSMIASQWTDGCTADDLPDGGIAMTFYKMRSSMVQEVSVEKATPAPAPAPVSAPAPQPTPAPTPTPSPTPPATTEKPVVEEKELPKKQDMQVEVINFSGSIDESNLLDVKEPVEEIMEKPYPYYLILDFSKLDYFNSLFIGTLAGWNTTLQNRGGRLAIIGASESAQEILDLCGLWSVIPHYPTLVEANNAV